MSESIDKEVDVILRCCAVQSIISERANGGNKNGCTVKMCIIPGKPHSDKECRMSMNGSICGIVDVLWYGCKSHYLREWAGWWGPVVSECIYSSILLPLNYTGMDQPATSNIMLLPAGSSDEYEAINPPLDMEASV